MIRSLSLTLPLLAILTVPFAASADGDVDAGKSKAAMCAGCHGMNGIGVAPTFPDLAGKDAAYIETQLQAFKKGERQNPIMNNMVAGLTDADIENLAAYFASLPARP